MFNSAVVCMYYLFVLCMLAATPDSLVDQPQAEGTFPVQTNSHLSVIQKNFYKFDRPGVVSFYRNTTNSHLSISTKPGKNC